MRRRQISIIMAVALGSRFLCGFAAPVEEQDRNAEPVIVEDVDAYENLEVLALWEDGSLEVYSCESKADVLEKIRVLADEETIAVVQPNYRYEKQALNTNDTAVGEQWALDNDGTFQIEVEKNRYAVYNQPFGKPSAPGEWGGMEPYGEFMGILVQTERKHAVEGIDIHMAEAWEKYGNGTHDTIVAMIDTGIDVRHEDLADAVWINTDEIPDNGIDDDGNGYVDDVYGWNFYHNTNQVFVGDEDSHGTHGAGTIRANGGNGIGIAGIVPGNRVRVMAVKALGSSDGDGSTADLIRAIRYAEDNGAVICNLSLTSTVDDRALYQAIASSEMLFVVAAGNGDPKTGRGVNTDETAFYPAAYDLDNIISVANLSFDGSLSASSNYGAETVDLAAPGTYILSTTPGNSYGYMSGTSMAAPMVTGVAAMVYSYFEGIGPADVKEILMNSVTPLESLAGKVKTGGMLNAEAALSFDVNLLTRRGFEKGGHRPENGTAPYMEAQTLNRRGGTYLQLRVLDVDGDLEVLLYAKGEVSEQEFLDGTMGTTFAVNEHDTVTFRIDSPGVYSFYARDKRGNQTVKMVQFVDMSEGPGAL